MSLQNTRLARFQRQLWDHLSQGWFGPWRRRSVALISLLLGFYLGTNLTSYYLQKLDMRPLVVLVMVVIVELLVFLRSRVVTEPWPLRWLALDNLRLGAVYAVVLEAFKLGS
ncbi:MAG: DUF565 domain-containing protein [Prochlorococcus sp.]|nr:DUF565 domain-containing protein [Prochlorococcaceae cyanobacterium ETNP2_MAG_10]MDP6196511.1 DUF565 domain-containing protein [Prochlorococcaceae cyanobacterium ETNP18_MAG_17]|tara:strand:- start:22 stop:357 length:336 start_codon:yes stop_codon:yes gene_type:complete